VRLPRPGAPARSREEVDPAVRQAFGFPAGSYWLRTETHWILVRARTWRRRLRDFGQDLWWGLAYGYPVCCVLRYSFDSLDGEATPGDARGGRRTRGGEVYVPCGIFHRRTN
jgi:hypothetical protein